MESADDIIVEFQAVFAEDRQAGKPRSLAHYQARFPGHDDVIAGEFERLSSTQPPNPGRWLSTDVLDGRHGERAGNSLSGQDVFGPYRLKEELGRGGQGVVYRATDTRMGRAVALKVLRHLGPGADQIVERFRREAQAAAKTEHPGVCPVYDAGVEDGIPYIAMRFVEGETLARRIAVTREEIDTVETNTVVRLHAVTTDEETGTLLEPVSTTTGSQDRSQIMTAVHLIEKTARALHAVHEGGIVHRDVKPGNVMVTPDGEAVVMDFGLARDDESDLETLTRSGDLFGTPAYMSPEQLTSQRIRLDRRTDIWSMGVMLYECVTLKRPFEASSREGLYQAILTKEPESPRRLNSTISRDLAVIIETALEKDRDRRYQTALAFADDLGRVRAFEPIRARPAGPLLRLRRWARRHPAAAALLLFLVAVSILSALGAARYKTVAEDALAANELAARRMAQVEDAHREASAQRDAARLESYAASLAAAEASLSAHEGAEVRRHLDSVASPLRGWEWWCLDALSDRSCMTLDLSSRTAVVNRVAWGPRGTQLAAAFANGLFVIIDPSSFEATLTRAAHRNLGSHDQVFAAAYRHDGARLATCSQDKTIKIWDTKEFRVQRTLRGHATQVRDVAWSPDGRRLASGCDDGTIRVWDAETGDVIAEHRGHRKVVTVVFHRDGDLLASASEEAAVRLWDATTLRELAILRGHSRLVNDLEFSPDGELLASVSSDRTCRIWDLNTRKLVSVLRGHKEPLTALGFSPDGALLATASGEGDIIVWDVDSAAERLRLCGHRGAVTDVAFSPDGRRLASGGRDMTIRMWDVARGRAVSGTWPLGAAGYAVATDPTSRRVAVPSPKVVRILDADTGTELAALSHGADVLALAFSPDGRRLASGATDGTTRLWDTRTGTKKAVLGDRGEFLRCVAFSPNGTRLATGSHDGTARIWDAVTGKCLATLKGHGVLRRQPSVMALAFSPDGSRLVTGSHDRTCIIWDVAGARKERVLGAHRDTVWSVTFSPDGRRVISGSRDGTIGVWDPDTGARLDSVRVGAAVTSLAFSPDGTRLACAAASKIIIRDAATLRALGQLRGHSDAVWSVAWSPDGQRLFSTSVDGTLRVWDSVREQTRFQQRTRRARVTKEAGVLLDALVESTTTDGAPDWLEIHEQAETRYAQHHFLRAAMLDLILERASRSPR